MNCRAYMVIVPLCFTACDTSSDSSGKKVDETKVQPETSTSATDASASKMTKTQSGLGFVILKEGEGSSPPLGSKVKVQWKGWLPDGKVFEESITPQEYRLDSNTLIAGWVEALSAMKKGEKRRLHIPSRLGYKDGYGELIPRNTDLDFELELLSFTEPK